MKKILVKITSVLLAVLVVFGIGTIGISVSAAVPDGTYEYTTDGMTGFVYTVKNGEITIESRWLKDEFVVPESIDGLPVTAVYCSGDGYWESTSIEEYIDTVIYIPASVKEVVGNGTKKFVVDKDNPYLSSDDHGVLFDKNKETLISYPKANNAKEYVVPATVKYIADNAFRGAVCLESLVLNEGLLEIGLYAVAETVSLKTVNIPSTVTSVHNSSFTEGRALEAITVDENNQYYSSDEYGVLFDKEKTKLMQYPAAAPAESYVIPDGVTAFILDWYGPTLYPFDGAHNLKEITIPASVTSEMHFSSYMSFFEKINVSPDHTDYKSVDGVVYSKDGTALVNYPGASKKTCLVIADGVTTIGSRFNFPTHQYLASIVYNEEISESITPIEDGKEYYDSENPLLTDIYYMGDGEPFERTAVNTYDYKTVTYHYNCKPDDHFHDYKFEITKAPNCSYSGEATLTCSCGKTLTAKVKRNGTHNYASELTGYPYETCCAAPYDINGIICENCGVGGYIYFTSKENSAVLDVKTTISSSEYGGRTATSVCNICDETVKNVYIEDGYRAIVFKNNGWDFVAKIKPGDPVNINYVPETEGKTFLGWEDGNGDVVDVPETMPDEDLYLRAVWADAPEPEPDTNGVFVAGTLVSGDETGYWLTVDGALVADGASAGNYNVKYEPATEISADKITLNNAVITQSAPMSVEEMYDIYSVIASEDASLDIEVIGTNKFDVLPENEKYSAIFGVGCGSGDTLNVYGDGSLEMNLGNEKTIIAYGINGGTVNISGDTKISADLKGCQLIGGYSLYATSISDNASLELNLTYIEKFIDGLDTDESVGYKITYDGLKLFDNAQISVNISNPESLNVPLTGFEIKGNLELSGNSHLSSIVDNGTKTAAIGMNNGSITASGTSTITAKAGNASEESSWGIYMYDGYATELHITLSDDAKIIASAGDAVEESYGIYAFADLTASNNAYISGTSGASYESIGMRISDISLSDYAEVNGIAGKGGYTSLGFDCRNLTASDDSKITAVADVADGSWGLNSSDVVANGNSNITAESKGSISRASMGFYADNFKSYDNAVINAKGGVSTEYYSVGIYTTDDITIYGSSTVNASADTAAEFSFGLAVSNEESNTQLIVTENATVNVSGGKGTNSYGLSVETVRVSGNAVINAEGSDASEISAGINCTKLLLIKDNAAVYASGGVSDYYSFGIRTEKLEILDLPVIKAKGNSSAILNEKNHEIIINDDAYVTVSTDTNPENAFEWDGESNFASYRIDDEIIDQIYKYVSISPAPVIHKVTYYLTAGGEVYDTKTFAEGETIVHPVPETGPGISFIEWTDENGNPLPEVMGTEDIVAYAVLRIESYNATYMVDDFVHEKYTVTYGAEVPVPDAPEKEGFVFVGWTPEIPGIMPANDLTFIAVFEKISYTLTYDTNGGAGTVDKQTGDSAYIIGSNVPFRSGYNFLGWSTDKNSTSAEYIPGDTINLTADTTLYAVWAKKSYFLAESDIFSFVNSRSNFKTGTYTMTDSDFIKLTDYVRNMYSTKLAETYINRLQVARSNAWGGSCFGMSMSVILNKTGQIDFVENFDPTAENMYAVARPYQNEAVQSAINYYQISQRVNGFRTTTYTVDKGNFSKGLEKLVNTVKDGNMTLLIYSWPEGCHAIVIVGYEKAEDGGHNLIAYDNRYGSKYINVYIDEEYTACTVNGNEEAYYVEFNADFSVFDKIDIDGPGNDMVFTSGSESIGTEIGIKLNGNVTIKNAEGETLTVNNGIIGGDMEVLSSYMIVNSTSDDASVPGTLMLVVEDSDFFTFDSTADEITASLTTEDCYAEVNATADEVTISEDEGIYTTGDDVEFNGWLSLNNDMGDIINFDGQGDGEVNFLYGNDGEIIVEGADDESTITVYSNLVDVDEVTFSSEYETLNISGETDNIAITASSKNDGVFDVKVAEINNRESVVAIAKPSTTTIKCGDSIILHADISNIPSGGYVEWKASNDCFTYTVSEDGSTCKITSDSNGSTVFTVTIYDAQGNAVSKDEQTMTSKAGFFDKIIAFFKKLFGLTKTIPQIYKDIF